MVMDRLPSPDEVAAEMSRRGRAWAEMEQAANMLEETRKSVIASATLTAEGSSQAAKEAAALTSQLVRDHIKAMVEARGKATLARVNYDVYRVFADHVRSKLANDRAEMGIR